MAGYGETPYGDIGYGLGTGDITPPIIEITDVSRYKISDETGFDSTTISWFSNEDGIFWVEINGTSRGTGYFIESGSVTSGIAMETIISDVQLEDSDSYMSDGTYRVNIYVTDSSGNTTPWQG